MAGHLGRVTLSFFFYIPRTYTTRNHSTTNNQLEVEQSVFPLVLLWPAACDLNGASRSKTDAKTEMGTFKQVRGHFCWHSKPCSELLVLSHPQLPLPVQLSLRKDLNTHPFNSFAKQEHYISTQPRRFPRSNLLESVLKTHQCTFCLCYRFRCSCLIACRVGEDPDLTWTEKNHGIVEKQL